MAKVKCKYCGEKQEKAEMELYIRESKSGRRYREYYHPECLSLKQSRQKATDLFYEYTGSLEPKKMLNTAFKQMKEQGMNEHEILYTMQYIVKNNCVLNYAMGIKYYATPAIKEYKSRKNFLEKQKTEQKRDTSIGIVTSNDKTDLKRPRVKDELDISNFL